jgi:hypothetical protein
MTPRTALGWRTCEACGHEFRREASEVDGRVLWFHYGTEAVGPKGDAALCRCLDCQRWCPPAPKVHSNPERWHPTKIGGSFIYASVVPRFPVVEGEPAEVDA